jgi:hypothetical protein
MMKTSKGGAGMIGGVRSPMATPSHGLVGSKTSMRSRGIDNATSGRSLKEPTVVKSPVRMGDIVK